MAVWAVALSSTELVSRRLAPALRGAGIQSLVGREPDRSGPFHPVALPPASMHEAIPKDVSGRTSYYPARLEFHHVPQLIRGRFNGRRCGPPQGFAPASSWSWQDRRVSGADTRTESPCSGSLSLRLRVFPLASPVYTDSQAHSSIGTASDLNVLRHLVSTRFQDLFHSPPGVLFTFPSRYLFAIGSRTVFSLGGRSPRLRTGFHVSRLTLSHRLPRIFGYGALTPCGAAFQRLPLTFGSTMCIRAPPLSLATTHGIDLSFFSSGYFDVSVPRVAFPWLCVPHGMTCQWHVGFPHSDVPGSRLTSSSPGLIAGCRVLLRYPAPRHPPRALQTSVPYGTDPNCTGSRKLFLLWLIRICLTYYASQQTEDTLLCPLLFQKELWHSVFKEHAVISHCLFRGFAPRKPNGMTV